MQRTNQVKPGINLEYIMWWFTRVSGIGMLLLALTGFIGALMMGARTQTDLPTLLRWTFFPNPNHVLNSEIPDVNLGWANAFWTTIQILLIIFAGTHAWNGLRMILEDYIRSRRWRALLRYLVLFLWLASLVVAIILIITSWA